MQLSDQPARRCFLRARALALVGHHSFSDSNVHPLTVHVMACRGSPALLADVAHACLPPCLLPFVYHRLHNNLLHQHAHRTPFYKELYAAFKVWTNSD